MNTLLVFAKEPVPGRVKTRLATTIGEPAACRLYRAFLADMARHLTLLTDIEVVWWVDGDPGAVVEACGDPWGSRWGVLRQPPGTLGERLEAAFSDAFATAPGPVGVVGSDCPHCGPAQFESLFEPLEKGSDAVVLPAEDGGYAGLALGAPVPDLFRDIPWSTARVAAATLERLRQAARTVEVLTPVFDVDTAAELERLRRVLAQQPERAPCTALALANLSTRTEAGR